MAIRIHLTAPDGPGCSIRCNSAPSRFAGFEKLYGEIRIRARPGLPVLTYVWGRLLTMAGSARLLMPRPAFPIIRSTTRAHVLLTDPFPGGNGLADAAGAILAKSGDDGERVLVTDSGLLGEDLSQVQFLTNADGKRRWHRLFERAAHSSTVPTPRTASSQSTIRKGPVARSLYAYDCGNGEYCFRFPPPLSSTFDLPRDTNGASVTSPLAGHLGGIRPAAGEELAVDALAGETISGSFVLRASELDSVRGSALMRLEISGDIDPTALRLAGLAPDQIETTGGTTVALFRLTNYGLFRFDATAETGGPLTFRLSIAGDVNQDGAVDSSDLAAYGASPTDLDGNGSISEAGSGASHTTKFWVQR